MSQGIPLYGCGDQFSRSEGSLFHIPFPPISYSFAHPRKTLSNSQPVCLRNPKVQRDSSSPKQRKKAEKEDSTWENITKNKGDKKKKKREWRCTR
ncbi:hypothetical protein TNCT_329111 [Trichonephila clavata]|uniref:Uncharacterized protein n=1 Tax=Trichonephila clavata TaxID=2740835 RepID=A0A8X6M406_TRICU|nr:hypothetical protein TNCT_329111 [Trichonephila clavata]